jgi:hypothetical protein
MNPLFQARGVFLAPVFMWAHTTGPSLRTLDRPLLRTPRRDIAHTTQKHAMAASQCSMERCIRIQFASMTTSSRRGHLPPHVASPGIRAMRLHDSSPVAAIANFRFSRCRSGLRVHAACPCDTHPSRISPAANHATIFSATRIPWRRPGIVSWGDHVWQPSARAASIVQFGAAIRLCAGNRSSAPDP